MYFNGLLLLSAQFVRIATNDMLVITNGTVFVSAHRVQIATGNLASAYMRADFVSAHRVQIATGPDSAQPVVVILCLSALRADHNSRPSSTRPDTGLCLSALRADHNGKCA